MGHAPQLAGSPPLPTPPRRGGPAVYGEQPWLDVTAGHASGGRRHLLRSLVVVPEEHRRVIAATHDHARALADNLGKQGFEITGVEPTQWSLRKPRRRGDILVTIAITAPAGPVNWGPPTGPPAT